MNQELEKQLISKYPKLFRDINKPFTESLMGFGCECEDGWFKILDNLCGYIQAMLDQIYTVKVKEEFRDNSKEGWKNNYIEIPGPEVVFTQIKEKYGSLRVYYLIKHDDKKLAEIKDYEKVDHEDLDSVYYKIDQRIQAGIDFCEYMSTKTCEVTGKPGSLCKRGSWLKTLCPEKAEELGYTLDLLEIQD